MSSGEREPSAENNYQDDPRSPDRSPDRSPERSPDRSPERSIERSPPRSVSKESEPEYIEPKEDIIEEPVDPIFSDKLSDIKDKDSTPRHSTQELPIEQPTVKSNIPRPKTPGMVKSTPAPKKIQNTPGMKT